MQRLAILTGGGSLPLAIAASARARGVIPHLVAIHGEADARVEQFAHTWICWGAVGHMLRSLQSGGDGRMVIAGSVSRPDLMTIRPDLGFFRNIPTVIKLMQAGGDDAVLTRAVRFFELNGLDVLGVYDVAPELLAREGQFGTVAVTPSARQDVVTGRAVVAALGDLDVGQSIIVRDGQVLAIEGAEGTDRMIQRVADLSASAQPAQRSGVLVKVPKPGQELRVDMPSIGPNTINYADATGLAGIAVAAGATLVLEARETVRRADEAGLFIAGDAFDRHAPPRSRTKPIATSACLGQIQSNARDLADAAIAVEVIRRLGDFRIGCGAVVIRSHVLAVAAAEGPAAMATRVAGLRQWGTKRLKSARGAMAVRLEGAASPASQLAAIIAQLSPARLAGVAVVTRLDGAADRLGPDLIAMADAAGLFIVTAAVDHDTGAEGRI